MEKWEEIRMYTYFEILWVESKGLADQYAFDGYEPIECAFGAEGSTLGRFAMDHHGSESWREGVALRAYRDHFGAGKANGRFVVTGAADADACFCIAALAGLLPEPVLGKDFMPLARLINQVDTNPIGVRLEESEEGAMLLLWNQMSSGVQDATSFYAGVDRWRKLLSRPPKALLEAVKEEEKNRVAEARRAVVTPISPIVSMVESSTWGFDVWYAEVAPVIVAFVAAGGNVTIGCANKEEAERFFGVGGLKNVFEQLEPKGWGGRESVGGSPRGEKLTREQAMSAAQVVAKMVRL